VFILRQPIILFCHNPRVWRMDGQTDVNSKSGVYQLALKTNANKGSPQLRTEHIKMQKKPKPKSKWKDPELLMWVCLWLCTTAVHITAQNSSVLSRQSSQLQCRLQGRRAFKLQLIDCQPVKQKGKMYLVIRSRWPVWSSRMRCVNRWKFRRLFVIIARRLYTHTHILWPHHSKSKSFRSSET